MSSLCETGKIRLAGYFRELEDELCSFTTHGFTGEQSPNRADAMVWGMSDIFPELLRYKEKPEEVPPVPFIQRRRDTGWMHS